MEIWTQLQIIALIFSLVCNKSEARYSILPASKCSENDGFQPDPADVTCQKFHLCESGLPILSISCSSGTVFQRSLQKCVLGNGCDAAIFNSQEKISVPEFNPYSACPHEKHVVCYYPSWGKHRPGESQFTHQNIDFSLCTHIIFGFVEVSPNFEIVPRNDSITGFLDFVSMKERYPKVKFLIGLGGWEHSTQNKELYQNLFASPSKSQVFTSSVKTFLQTFSLDGLDVVYLHPGSDDKANYARFMGQLKSEFKQNDYLLTATISGALYILRDGFDFEALEESVDHYHILAYEFHGFWDAEADHHTPLYKRPWDESGLDVESVIDFFISNGINLNKIVLGIPSLGRTFRVAGDSKEPPLPKTGKADAGTWTKDPTSLAYFEICQNILNQNWTFVDQPSAPYAFKDDQWVGFDSPLSVQAKAEYIKDKGLRGAMMFHLGDSDFLGLCGPRYPLLRAINSVFRRPPCRNFYKKPRQVQPTSCRKTKKVICYYTSWAKYRSGFGNFEASDVNATFCTHLVYAFLNLGDELKLSIEGPAQEDLLKFTEIKAKYPKVKYLASIGGSSSSNTHRRLYHRLLNESDYRITFAKSAVAFLKHYNFDGLDLDYQPDQKTQSKDHCEFTKVLGKYLFDAGMDLTTTIKAKENLIKEVYDIQCLSDHTDALVALTYNLHATSENNTGHLAPLESLDASKLDVKSVLELLLQSGASPEKLVLAIPAYGQTFTTEGSAKDPPQKVIAKGRQGPLTSSAGILSYTEICLELGNGTWNQGGTDVSGPYMYKENQWVGYDDSSSIKAKVNYVLDKGFGGVMLWEIAFDDFNPLCSEVKNPLLTTIHQHLCEESVEPRLSLTVETF
uniref:Chitinase 5 n=1 Tax=Tigriopus japonicus TaxID=158387 RepID=A0A1U9XQT5_TIGJA|nr:chitinase 5 [Tigriopus japonicus]